MPRRPRFELDPERADALTAWGYLIFTALLGVGVLMRVGWGV